MNKLTAVISAGALALALGSGIAFAADKGKTDPGNNPPPRTSENQPGDPGAVKTAPEQAAQDQEYQAALKKCDAMKGGEKQKCIDAADRKFGRM